MRGKVEDWEIDSFKEKFRKWGWSLVTGAEGLERGELRRLERSGLVDHELAKLPSGSIISRWRWKGKK